MTCELPTKEEVAAYKAAENRRNKIYEELQILPMSHLILVEEFMTLWRFMHCAASEKDLCFLERKILELNQKYSYCKNCQRTIPKDEEDHRC